MTSKLQEYGFTEECADCKGTLYVDLFNPMIGESVKVECTTCYQMGEIPTELGEQLIKLISIWGHRRV